MIVAVPSGNGQQNSAGRRKGCRRSGSRRRRRRRARGVDPAGVRGRRLLAGEHRALLRAPRASAASIRASTPSPSAPTSRGRPRAPAALVAEPVGADRPAALAALPGPLGLGLRQLGDAREQPGDRGVALAALHRLQRAGAQARRERGELVARAARPGRRLGRERERPRRRAGGARVPLQLQGEGRHGIADGTCSQAGLPTDTGNTAVTWKHSPVRNSVLP